MNTPTSIKGNHCTKVFPVDRIRQDFPILKQEVRGKHLVYLDNAASGQKPLPVINAIADYYKTTHANVHRGVHYLSEKSTIAFEQAREKMQRFINAKEASEIIFVRGATEAINLVASSYGLNNIKAGDEIILSEMEHHSNIVPWQMLAKQTGAIIKVVPFNDRGELLFDQLKKLITPKTKLVAIVHISNALGTINPVKEIIATAHQQGIPVLVDGAQAAPHCAIDVQDLDCDFYAISGHKLFGPTGIGILYGKKQLLNAMPPYQGGGEMIKRVSFTDTEFAETPQKFEAGTPHIAGAIGLGATVDYLNKIGMSAIQAYEQELLNYANLVAKEYPAVKLIGTAANKASIFSFILGEIHAHDVGTIMDQYGIAIRTGHHCAMPVMEHFKVPATARASFAFYNTKDEVEILFGALQKVVEVFN